jgi:HTH-type transcriptional regulator/antitoxin HigA
MQENSLRNKDLVEIIGSKSKVSEVLNKKRRLTLEMIRKLSKNLHIPTELLINEYELTEHR